MGKKPSPCQHSQSPSGSPAQHHHFTTRIFMLGRGVLALLARPLEMPCRWGKEKVWPNKIVRDSAYLFLPFSFVIFLLLLGAALLITWGRLSNGVLVGFCITAGILIGLFAICHLALYCAWAKCCVMDAEKRGEASSSSGSGSSDPIGRPVRVVSPRICGRCLGGVARVDMVALQSGSRDSHQVSRRCLSLRWTWTRRQEASSLTRRANTRESCRPGSKRHPTKASRLHQTERATSQNRATPRRGLMIFTGLSHLATLP